MKQIDRLIDQIGLWQALGRATWRAFKGQRYRPEIVAFRPGLHHAWRDGDVDDLELTTRSTALFAHAKFGDDVAWRRSLVQRVGDPTCESEAAE